MAATFCSTRFLRISLKFNTEKVDTECKLHMERLWMNHNLMGLHAMTHKLQCDWTMKTQALGSTHRHKMIGCLLWRLNSGSNRSTQPKSGFKVANRFCKCETRKILRSTSRSTYQLAIWFALRSELIRLHRHKLSSETSVTVILICGAGGTYPAVTPTSSICKWRWRMT